MIDDRIEPFTFPGLPTRIEFGRGARFRAAAVCERAGFRRVLVVTTARGTDVLAQIDAVAPIGAVGVFAGSRTHVPTPTVREAREMADAVAADGVVAIGGGSAVGLAKAIAHYDDIPYVALPTSLAGSEMTSVWGETTDGHKRTARDERVRPREVIYDPELLATLPTGLAVQSALNALAHVTEAAYAPDTSPLVQSLAREAAAVISGGLESLSAGDRSFDRLLYGASIAGMCLSSAAMGIHHKICHVVGGALDLPHAATHAIVLPHVLALNLPAAGVADSILSAAFASPRPESRIQEVLRQASAPVALRELGASREAVRALAGAVVADLGDPQRGPVVVTAAEVEALLDRAWTGIDAKR